ncbi:MAG TPA: hypothetical protein VLM85_31360 [Polyangiaceae bacterium]|nr:hypothetical protein [Polyangiaceae bacterium]
MRTWDGFGLLRWVGVLAIVPLGGLALHLASCVSNDTGNPTCANYCTDMMKTCAGDTQQYIDEPTCEHMCAVMDAGTPGVGNADTVACRELNLSNAKDVADGSAAQYTACVSGGVAAACCSSGQQCQCETFCNLDLALCTGSNAVYQSLSQCMTACATWRQDFSGPLTSATGNTLQCRTYHLERSQSGQFADLVTHCKHTGDPSGVCMDAPNDAGAGDAGSSDATTD